VDEQSLFEEPADRLGSREEEHRRLCVKLGIKEGREYGEDGSPGGKK